MRQAHIGLVPVADKKLVDLQTVDWRGPARMFFSRDGRHLAYDLAIAQTGQRDLFVMDMVTRRPRPVVTGPSNDVVAGWSPDGMTLIFTRQRLGSRSVWGVLIPDGKTPASPQMIAGLDSRAFTIGVTTAGSLIYGLQTSSQNVHVADIDFLTGKLLSPPVEATDHYQVQNSGPDWNPRDGRLLIATDFPGIGKGLSILPVKPRGPISDVAVPQMSGFHRPRWAPDGSATVQGTRLDGTTGIFRIDLESGEPTPLVVCECTQASWAPDGSFFIYRRQTKNEFAIVKKDMRTGEEEVLLAKATKGAPGIQTISLSPDGKLLAYISVDVEPVRRTLFVRPLAGGDERKLLETRQLANVAEWADDAHLIIGRPKEENLVSFSILAIDDNQELEIRDFAAKAQATTIRIHPDRKRVAFSLGDPRQEVWTMTNFLPGSKPVSK